MRKYLIIITILFLPSGFIFGAPSAEQQFQTEELQKKEDQLRKKVEEKKTTPQIEKETFVPTPVPDSSEKALIKTIQVTGVTLVPEKEIRSITQPYENKELNIKEMYQVADKITDLYRRKSYITSRAYLPPQKIEIGILEIRVLEGITGTTEVKGNRYFKSKLLLKQITLKKGDPFNYDILRRDMSKINETPDVFSRAVLVPGKEPGQTDIVLEVKDQLPIHAGFTWDNYGSRYIDSQRFNFKVSHNNLLGFGDSLNLQFQMGQQDRYYLENLSYLFPLSKRWKVGASATLSKVKLGKEFEDSNVRGKTKVYSLFANNALIDKENFNLNLNFGFDYKDMINSQQDAVTSHDRLRVVKAGFDIDASDKFGRTLFTYEIDTGIPNIMGGMGAKDSNASTPGAGGKFVKNVLNLFRLQNLPFSMNLLWKTQAQLSPYILPSAEQFQIGGIANVRGYAPAEAVGDSGLATTFEFSLPVYPIPKNIKVPFSKAKLYDALRLAVFYDLGNTHLRRPGTDENKNTTLRSVGCGARFNLPEDFSVRVDLGWPLDKTPSDGDHLHTWAMVSKSF